MSLKKLIIRNLLFFKQLNLALLAGTFISATIITGALIIGDTVTFSLKKLTLDRLGKTDYALITGERFVNADIAERIRTKTQFKASSVLQLQGIVKSDINNKRINEATILGVDEYFWDFGNTGNPFDTIQNDGIVMSRFVADKLDISENDRILLRIEKPSFVPLNSLFVKADNQYVSQRFTVKKIIDNDQFARFSLKTDQKPPANVFLSAQQLNELFDMQKRANIVLLSSSHHQEVASQDVLEDILPIFTLSDFQLEVHSIPHTTGIELLSNRIFLDRSVVKSVEKIFPESDKILTYFVNEISTGEKSTPYSFVSAPGDYYPPSKPADNEIIVNEWLAKDLRVTKGDTLTLKYYVTGALKTLHEENRIFRVKKIIPVDTSQHVRSLTPEFPGLSDVDNCRDWSSGIPIDLDKIREKDEDYWDEFRGTPKAFISPEQATEMWSNRHGKYTAIRFESINLSQEELTERITQAINPESLGLAVRPVREEGLEAATEGVNFGELFLGLSFFVLAAGILLTALLFALNIENRNSQTGTFLSLGFTNKQIMFMYLSEGFILAFLGSLAGLFGGLLYNTLIIRALNSLWYDIVRTTQIVMHVEISSLVIGVLSGVFISIITMYLVLRKKHKSGISTLQKESLSESNLPADRKVKYNLLPGIILVIVSLLLVAYAFIKGKVEQTVLFFVTGTLLLTGLVLLTNYFLLSLRQQKNKLMMSLYSLSIKNTTRRKGRSLVLVSLLAIGVFLVLATGANRKNPRQNAHARSSGTGGFAFFGETTLPILYDLNTEKGREEFNIPEKIHKNIDFIQFKAFEGDDASCLNLNKIKRPRILGVQPARLHQKNAFRFVAKTQYLDVESPWLSLNQELTNNVIPAIADQTVIRWSLGMQPGDTLTYLNESGDSLKLKLIGGLANSVFQGNVIISQKNFTANFPSNSGTKVFLIDAPFGNLDTYEQALLKTFRNKGLELTRTATRLAAFNSVTNTYLSIFLALGGLGLVIGTIGMGIVIYRNVSERLKEIAILHAIGYRKKSITKMLFIEHVALMLISIMIGIISGIVSVFPSILNARAAIPYNLIVFVIAAVIISGLVAIVLSLRTGLKKNLNDALRNE